MAVNESPMSRQEDDYSRADTIQNILSAILIVLTGAILASALLPEWLPGLTASLLGPDPKVYWYLSRGSAITAFWMLWLSMALGVIITNKMAQIWPGAPTAFDLHQFTSLFGLAGALFHAIILMGDNYINFSLGQIFTPFTSVNYRPFWVGVGQISFYVWAIVAFSFYIRRKIGQKTWRWIHFAGYLSFAGVLAHATASGTDSTTIWAVNMYWFSAGSLFFLTVYRVLVTRFKPRAKKKSNTQHGVS